MTETLTTLGVLSLPKGELRNGSISILDMRGRYTENRFDDSTLWIF